MQTRIEDYQYNDLEPNVISLTNFQTQIEQIFPDYSPQNEIAIDSNPAEKAMEAVEEIGPRTFKIKEVPDNYYFIALGCHGSGLQAQKDVSKQIDDYVVARGHKPLFVLYAGDNIYNYGARSPDDPAFKDQYENIYHQFPGIAVLGNHDANLHKASILSPHQRPGKSSEINEVAHHYFPDKTNKYRSVAKIKEVTLQQELSINDLQLWNMPYYYFSYDLGSLQIICLNSNSLLSDFYHYKKGDLTGEKYNQIKFYLETYAAAKNANKTIAVLMHHPVFVHGKRTERHDTNLFLKPEEIRGLQKIFDVKTESYYEMLDLMFDHLAAWPNTFFTAHEHAMSYFNNIKPISCQDEKKTIGENFRKSHGFQYSNKICQAGIGGGGGDLEKRKNFKPNAIKNTGFFQSAHGFVVVNCSQHNPNLSFEFPMNYGQRYTNLSATPLQLYQTPMISNFSQSVKNAAIKYFEKLNRGELIKKESYSNFSIFKSIKSVANTATNYFKGKKYVEDDLDAVQHLLAYLNQPELKELRKIIKFFVQQLDKMQDQTFRKLFINQLKINFDVPNREEILAIIHEEEDVLHKHEFEQATNFSHS